ncbi:MAG TPA: DUF4333 domain-containing protein, partial [Longimicrobium sp.]|nr:DUF4333 domain-containing protein [Longimicrobium sp.]
PRRRTPVAAALGSEARAIWRNTVSRRLLLGLLAGATLALPGCGGVVLSTDTLTAAEVATAAEDALEGQVGTRPDITCPEALEKTEGASTRCTLTGGDDPVEYGVTVTVESTDDPTRIGVQVDDEPKDEGSSDAGASGDESR